MSLEVVDYSEKAIAVFGDTRNYKEELKALGGTFASKLSGGPGWIFSKRNVDAILNFVQQVNSGTYIKQQVQPVYTQPRLQPIQPIQQLQRPIAVVPSGLGTLPLQPRSPTLVSSGLSTLSTVPIQPRSPTLVPSAQIALPLQQSPKIIPQTRLESNAEFPNRFVAADGLNYQVIIYTVPLPQLNQIVNVTIGEEVITYTVVGVKQGSYIDSINLSDGLEASLIAGKWKINGETREHMVTFH